ncbi:MAG: threonylcarbamoyl-AMP synthase [Ardenticatenaceae bacterium]|nr:threonylcarbamoyl-AMP synthase [Anaerolineales bacterium]MCB8921049.1 threonylcarbamoyl-AMP synthase [Ardenticatenaceae bacterium]MCB8991187.1 threonylcarbamoyl-AMP synthase [Ardenticatenaceae bacterium]MCB9005744.1 threonylcarbamoyl-AMP synthase [Ardenticatenaceae bacterium]
MTGQKAQLLPGTSAKAIAVAAQLLRQGQLVVFPTDTVYGVGVVAFDVAAVEKLFMAKQRPFHKGIPILLADPADLDKVAWDIPPVAHAYIAQYWPGPLTLVVPRRPGLPGNLAPNDTIAVRVPDCDIARAIIRQAGGAVAATSANLSEQPPAQTAVAGMASLGTVAAAVVDGGPSRGGAASTVVDCTVSPPQILRTGPITAHELLTAVNLSL